MVLQLAFAVFLGLSFLYERAKLDRTMDSIITHLSSIDQSHEGQDVAANLDNSLSYDVLDSLYKLREVLYFQIGLVLAYVSLELVIRWRQKPH